MKTIQDSFGGRLFFISILLLFLIALFLRVYRIEEFATFLGDQGRDAIVMKNIITFHDFTALGPITSVGSIYLGPFYYYFMAPWLGLFGLNPLGPAVGVALINSISVILFYSAVRDILNKKTALLAATFVTFSSVLIEFSRFSWNPNILPSFAFFTVYATTKAIRTSRWIWFAASGALLSASVQLHYLAIFLVIFVAGAYMFWILRNKEHAIISRARNLIAALAGFALVMGPFIIFEIKHRFPNLNSVVRFATENRDKGGTNTPLANLVDTSNSFVQYVFQTDIHSLIGGYGSIILMFLIITTVYISYLAYRKTQSTASNILYIGAAFLVLLFGTSVYHGPKFPHYLGALYFLFYALLAHALLYLVSTIGTRKGAIVIGIIVAQFVTINAEDFLFLWQKEGHKQMERSKKIAQTILAMNPATPYTLTTSPEAYADFPYRYYLDVWGKKPVTKEEDSYIPTKELFVICEKKCDPMADPQWTIAHFSAKRVADEKRAEGVYIYKLIK